MSFKGGMVNYVRAATPASVLVTVWGTSDTKALSGAVS
jgi:hypothetical protein